MAGTKNKTTHKHNMKVINESDVIDPYTGIEFIVFYNRCICGHWNYGWKQKHQMIFLPPDMLSK